MPATVKEKPTSQAVPKTFLDQQGRRPQQQDLETLLFVDFPIPQQFDGLAPTPDLLDLIEDQKRFS
jgi:hypothetical protein